MYEDRTSAEVIADSIWDGVRLTSMRVTLPNIIHKHLLRHRLFSEEDGDTDASFSFESQRAAPVKKHTNRTEADPFVPLTWRANDKGMSPSDYLDAETSEWMREKHYEILEFVAARVREMEARNLHKEQANRYLEPFQWTTCIITSTNWENFFNQRIHPAAQEEMRILGRAMRKALDESEPVEREIHVPFESDIIAAYRRANGVGPMDEKIVIQSVARCARVSYGRELEEKTYEEDVNLVVRLLKAGHASPFEHVGIVMPETALPYKQVAAALRRADHLGNFEYPWSQLRHHVKEYLPTIAARLDSEHST